MTGAARRVACFAALFLATIVPAADRHDVRAGTIVISDAWTRPTAAGMPMGVAYFTVRNVGATADAIISASTPVAARVEFHQTTVSDGMARMRPLKEIGVPAKSAVSVAPGGIHLMLVDLAKPLVAGTRVPLVLELRAAGRIEITLDVESRTQ